MERDGWSCQQIWIIEMSERKVLGLAQSANEDRLSDIEVEEGRVHCSLLN